VPINPAASIKNISSPDQKSKIEEIQIEPAVPRFIKKEDSEIDTLSTSSTTNLDKVRTFFYKMCILENNCSIA